MNNKKIFIIIAVCSIVITNNLDLISQDQKARQSDVDSIWEYEAAAVNTMTFILFKNGKFIYKDLNTKMESEGKWEYNLPKTQILLRFINNKDYWDKKIFLNKQFLEGHEGWAGYFNKAERKVGFYIHKSDVSGREYISFWSFNYYKK